MDRAEALERERARPPTNAPLICHTIEVESRVSSGGVSKRLGKHDLSRRDLGSLGMPRSAPAASRHARGPWCCEAWSARAAREEAGKRQRRGEQRARMGREHWMFGGRCAGQPGAVRWAAWPPDIHGTRAARQDNAQGYTRRGEATRDEVAWHEATRHDTTRGDTRRREARGDARVYLDFGGETRGIRSVVTIVDRLHLLRLTRVVVDVRLDNAVLGECGRSEHTAE